MPKAAVLIGTVYAYAAYDCRRLGGYWAGFVAAAAATMSIGPFTLFVMKPTNDKLHRAAKKEPGFDQTQVSALMQTWEKLNYMRCSLPLLGSLVGIWTFYHNAV